MWHCRRPTKKVPGRAHFAHADFTDDFRHRQDDWCYYCHARATRKFRQGRSLMSSKIRADNSFSDSRLSSLSSMRRRHIQAIGQADLPRRRQTFSRLLISHGSRFSSSLYLRDYAAAKYRHIIFCPAADSDFRDFFYSEVTPCHVYGLRDGPYRRIHRKVSAIPFSRLALFIFLSSFIDASGCRKRAWRYLSFP